LSRRKRLRKNRNKIKVIRTIAVSFGVTAVFIFLVVFALLADAVRLIPKLENPREARVDQTTKIYAADKKLITNLHAEQNRIVVPLEKIPKYVQQAIIAIEDKRFYQHHGVDLEAIARALVENLTRGRIVEGGSTITQQYVKNVYISSERTLNRKIKEAVLAYELEKRATKNKILENYLNTVYFGHGNYGVETAAEAFFGKKVNKLTLDESALLAGLIRSPQRYSPWTHKKIALARRNLVLSKMAEVQYVDKNGRKVRYISEVEAIKARAKSLVVTAPKPAKRYPGAYFVEYVRQQMLNDKRFGESEQDRANNLYKGGLRIYTTLSLRAQQIADEAVKNTLGRPGDPAAGLVAVQPKTGYVKAIAGGRDFFSTSYKYAKFNLATQAKRQTGSAFKVFVLTTAIAQGKTPYETFDSSPGTLKLPGGGVWKVDNYTEGRGYGRMSIKEGTVKSVNALYARLMLDVGAKNVVKTAHKMGITSKLEPYPAIALGGLKYGVNVLEMASSAATLANNGTYITPITITKITDSAGKVLLRNTPKPKRAIAPAVASTVTSILRDVITRGTGTRANIGRPAAGKTGTAQNYRDAWFFGYTPDLATAVWVGHPQGQVAMLSIHGMRVTGGSFPAMIWGQFMKEALVKTPKTQFPYSKYFKREPQTKICRGTADMLANDACPEDTTYYKTLSKEERAKMKPCNMHKTQGELPDVIGLSSGTAAKKLNSAGFGVSKINKYSDEPSGTVIDQSPSGGQNIKQGTTIKIYISKGEAKASIPSVVGQSQNDAVSTLTNAGFTASVTYQAGAPAEQVGKVISQNPSGGGQAGESSSVTIIVGQ